MRPNKTKLYGLQKVGPTKMTAEDLNLSLSAIYIICFIRILNKFLQRNLTIAQNVINVSKHRVAKRSMLCTVSTS